MISDHALIFDTECGVHSPHENLHPLLDRHGILCNEQVIPYFDDFCGRVIAAAGETGEIGPHRYWPSENGGVYLALLPWQGNTCFAIHFFEEPAPTAQQALLQQLTPREMEVLYWVADGKDNASIADILGISPGTARKHVQNILAKLLCENRTAAARLYTESWERYRH